MLTKAFKLENKSVNPALEIKSGYAEVLLGIEALSFLGLQSLSAKVAWEYYKKVDPLFNSVDYIATEGSEIALTILDTKEKQHIDEYDPSVFATELLKLLKKPNPRRTGKEFIYDLITSQLVTGDVFIVATGADYKKPPKELFYHGKQYVTIDASRRDGLASEYNISKPYYSERFARDGVNYRFYNESKTAEIKQIASQFNPEDGDVALFGMSKISPLYYQMEQHIQGNIHNTNLLKNGARPSGALIMKGLSNEAKDQLREQVKKFYSGTSNAGNVMALSVGGGGYDDVEFKELSTNNKDMDFVELKKMTEMAIYKLFKVPASFYDNQKSTYNNVSTDTFKIYDLAIIPTLRDIIDGLNAFLMPRYDASGRYKLSFSLRAIPALETRYITTAQTKIETGLLTIEEGRNLLNLPVWDKKEPLYNPKKPVKAENPAVPEPEPETEEEEEGNKGYDNFYKIAKADGFDDMEIKELAIEAGLLYENT